MCRRGRLRSAADSHRRPRPAVTARPGHRGATPPRRAQRRVGRRDPPSADRHRDLPERPLTYSTAPTARPTGWTHTRELAVRLNHFQASPAQFLPAGGRSGQDRGCRVGIIQASDRAHAAAAWARCGGAVPQATIETGAWVTSRQSATGKSAPASSRPNPIPAQPLMPRPGERLPQAGGQPEEREQPLRVEEVVDPGDPPGRDLQHDQRPRFVTRAGRARPVLPEGGQAVGDHRHQA